MNCPSCLQNINISETSNRFFLGRNSIGIPFFKCEFCGNLFYVDEKNKVARLISRGEKGYRFVPIIMGIFIWFIAAIMFWYLGGNIIACLIGGFLLWLGWTNIKMGLFASQKLIDEMCLDQKVPISKEVDEEFKKSIG